MKQILLVILVLISISLQAQVVQPPDKKVLVADETWIVSSGKSSFRVITSNDSICGWMIKKFQHDGLDKVTYARKSDRNGEYWERSLYFKNTVWNRVVTFINNKFK